jgi:ABC-2 type transport system ATP-binding protein
MSAAVVVLESLTRRFGAEPAVAGLSFEVGRGELFGIVGPDGAGKTTTLRMLAGVLPPSSGDARILGVSVARDPERVKPHIAYMAQRFGLYTDLTVRENILFYADLYRVPRGVRAERMARLYRFSGLGEFEQRLAGQLSGGMKQKLSLSCALIHHPEVLLLDEPTFGVDPISRRELWSILQQMVADGMTVVLSTSYMDEAERCDRVALLGHGRLLELQPPARLQRRLQGRLLVAHTAAPRRTRDLLRGWPEVVHATLSGDAVHVGVRADRTAAWLDAGLRQAGEEVYSVAAARPSLEDVYIDLMSDAGEDE